MTGPVRGIPSPRTGASVGTIRGGTVGITLANDALNPADDGAVAFNDVDLHTDVDSFRIRAATSSGVTLSDHPVFRSRWQAAKT